MNVKYENINIFKKALCVSCVCVTVVDVSACDSEQKHLYVWSYDLKAAA